MPGLQGFLGDHEHDQVINHVGRGEMPGRKKFKDTPG